MCNLENFILLGDFNSEIKEDSLKDFCDTYNLRNLVSGPTCFKSVQNPSSIDLILTNKPRSFQNTITVESGLSDHHKMNVMVMRSHFPKQTPILLRYRCFRNFENSAFRYDLKIKLNKLNQDTDYE